MNDPSEMTEVLHYVGYDDDRGGIVSVVRALAGAGRFRCRLGLNRGARQRRSTPLPQQEFSPVNAEVIGPRLLWRTRAVAREAREWLVADSARIFHGHSRAGLLVALWLRRAGEKRVVATVHSYGRQRWFYRWAARRLDDHVFWLSPEMKRHYGFGDGSWARCIPGCVPLKESDGRRPPTERGVRLRLGGIGALVRVKRWELVLEALAALPEALGARVSFRHIGGEGHTSAERSYAARLRARTRRLGLDSTVQWLGEQPSSAGLLDATDGLVVASHTDAFSVAMLEAWQRGVPVLAPDRGGAADAVAEGVTGWLFRHGDAQELSRVIAGLLESDALERVRIGPETWRRFSAPVVAAQWAEVYAGLLLRTESNAALRVAR